MKGITNPFQPLFDGINEISERLKRVEEATTKPVLVQTRKNNIPEGYLSEKEAAAYLSVSVRWIADRKASGLLAYYKFGGAVRYLPEDLDKLGTRHEARF